MAGPGTLEGIIESIAEVIASTLTAIPYQQLSAPTTDADCLEPWHESPFILDPAYTPPEALSHLGYSVLAAGSPNSNRDRDAYDGTMTPVSRVEVRFCYRLRGASATPSDQVADQRLAMRAAREIAALVNSEVWRAESDDCRVIIANRWRPITYESQYQIVSVDFDIYHEETLTFNERV